MRKVIQNIADLLDRSPEFFKEDVNIYELNRRFLWFVVFRLLVILAFVFLSITGRFLLPHIAVNPAEFLVMAVVLLFMNIVYWLYYKKAVQLADIERYARALSINVHVQLMADFLVLGYLSYKCGGIESPVVFFFLFHNVISCLFFKKWLSFVHVLASLCIIYFISLGPHFGLIGENHFIFPAEAALFYGRTAVYLYQLAGITIVYLVVWFFTANITDILKMREQRLQDKINELEEMDKERTRYMLVTTHELKAPFASIQSYVNILLAGYAGELAPKVSDVLFKIRMRCEKLTLMITKMLQLANLTSLKGRDGAVLMEGVDIFTILEAVVAHLRTRASEKGVSFNLRCGQNFKIVANSEQLDILFNNILLNAVNYCYPDTKIDVDVKASDDGILVSVSDKGIGIKKEQLERVFLEYFRTEKAALMNKESTGLGLTISRNIMDIHGGRIWIEGEEDMGTTVFMEFPKRG